MVNQSPTLVRRRSSRVLSGAALVEFAITLVVVITIVGALIEYGLSIQAGQVWAGVAQFVGRSITREFEGMVPPPLCSEVQERAQEKLDELVSSLSSVGYLLGKEEKFSAVASKATHIVENETDPSLSSYSFIRIDIIRVPPMFFGWYVSGSPKIHVESVGRIDCS